MAYEYTTALGYMEPGYFPPRRQVVEVYGTLPEAQEYVSQELELPYLPPAYALQPPLPKLMSHRNVTFLPVPFGGFYSPDAFRFTPSWRKHHRG